MTGECLSVLLLSWNALDVGEPNTAKGPVSSGEDALLFPVERRNGDVPLDVCECLATGLTCHAFGGGGVSLNLTIVTVMSDHAGIKRDGLCVQRSLIPSAWWRTNDKLNTRWAKGANIGGMTPVRIHTAFHTNRLRAWDNAASGPCVSARRRRLRNASLG